MFRRSPSTSEASLAAFADAHATHAVTVDVREPDEYAAAHVPGARNIPLSALGRHTGELSGTADTPVYVICASGNRSKAGAGLLSQAGIKALSVVGGTAAWVKAGHPVVVGSRPI